MWGSLSQSEQAGISPEAMKGPERAAQAAAAAEQIRRQIAMKKEANRKKKIVAENEAYMAKLRAGDAAAMAQRDRDYERNREVIRQHYGRR